MKKVIKIALPFFLMLFLISSEKSIVYGEEESGMNIPTNPCGNGYVLEGDACVPIDTSGVDWWSDQPVSSVKIPDTGLPNPSGGIKAILGGILSWLLGMLGIIGVIGFAISGIMYLVSAGDDDAIKRAKKGMTASIIGILVGLAGVVAIQAMENILKGHIF